MKLEKLVPNYRLCISKVIDDNIESKFCSFFSAAKPKILLALFKRRLKTSVRCNCKIVLKLVNLETEETYKKEFKYYNMSIEKIKVILTKYIFSMRRVIDTKHTRFQITVQNTVSSQLDSKIISFNSSRKLEELLARLKEDIREKIKKIKKEDIIFEYQVTERTTHYITLRQSGTLNRRKERTKSFGINLPNYSSIELIELLRGKNE